MRHHHGVVVFAASLLVLALADARAAQAQTVVWTLIDVKSNLDNDGRLRVVETHHLTLMEGGELKLTREFGLGADQTILFLGLTRLGPDGAEQALQDAEVTEPDRYRYYPMGHVYWGLPELPRGAEVAYRFEYELVNALSPAWAIAAGKGPLARPFDLIHPLDRARELVRDLEEARPAPDRLYRLDHDLLFPSRDGPGFEVRKIDYQLAYDTAWKLVDPEAELAQIQADQDYRVRRIFERVDGGAPSAVDPGPSRMRWLVLAVLAVGPLKLWFLLVLAEFVGSRLRGATTAESMAARLSLLSPEEVTALARGGWGKPTLDGVLARLAGERKITIEAERLKPEEDDDEPEYALRLRRLASLDGLPAFEREVVDRVFPDGRRDVTTAELNTLHAKDGFEPWSVIQEAMAASGKALGIGARPPRSFLALLLWLAALGGVALQVTSLSHVDLVPVALIADVLLLMFLRAWSRAYWHSGMPWPWLANGLLVGVGLIAGGAGISLLLAVNPPLPVRAFLGTGLMALAAYGAFLAGARKPFRGEPHAAARDLAGIRRYARRELRRAQPRLEDRFLPHLEALDLGADVEAWQSRRSAGEPSFADGSAPEDGSGAPLARPFTGRHPGPYAGPAGWAESLYVSSAEERQEMEEEEAVAKDDA